MVWIYILRLFLTKVAAFFLPSGRAFDFKSEGRDFKSQWGQIKIYLKKILLCRISSNFLLCCFKWCNWLKAKVHILQTKSCLPSWTFTCAFRLELHVNFLSHAGQVQLYGFPPVCVRMCFSIWAFWMNPFLQTLHKKGRWPLWILVWAVRLEICLKTLPHSLHVYSRSYLSWILFCEK